MYVTWTFGMALNGDGLVGDLTLRFVSIYMVHKAILYMRSPGKIHIIRTNAQGKDLGI